MSYSLRLHPALQADAADAAKHYIDIDRSLVLRFAVELERTLRLIEAYPLAGRVLYGDVRRMVLDRFPYLIIYRVVGSEIRVQLLVHARRDPKWIRRTTSRRR